MTLSISSGSNSWVRKIASENCVLDWNTFLMPGGRLALPVRADHHVVAGLAAGGAAADVAVIVGVAVEELHRVVALRVHRRDRKDDRLRAQVHPEQRIGRVAVRRDDGRVLVGGDVGLVLDLIERRLELPRIAVDGVFVHHAVVHHDRQAVDEACLGDVLCLEEARAVTACLRQGWGGLCCRGRYCRQRGGTKKIAFRQHGAVSLFVVSLFRQPIFFRRRNLPRSIDDRGFFSLGQYSRIIRTKSPAGAGSQFDSLSLPGESFWM